MLRQPALAKHEICPYCAIIGAADSTGWLVTERDDALPPVGKRGTAVAYYRIYFLDLAGHITAATEAHCKSDEEVISRSAETIGKSADAEIWQEARLIGRLSQLRTSS